MSGTDFVALYAKRFGVTKVRADEACMCFMTLLDELFDQMDPDERITFYGFGTFTKKRTPPRAVGDLKTGERIEIPAVDRIVFNRTRRRPDRPLKRDKNKGL